MNGMIVNGVHHGAMIATKCGIYLVRGDSKLKNIQLISWEQLLGNVEQVAGASESENPGGTDLPSRTGRPRPA
jgi:hypothetical protein